MQRRKCYYFIILYLIILILNKKSLFAQEIQADKNKIITISRIKLVINEERYLWEKKSELPEKQAGLTAPSTIISFLSLAPGEKISLKKLEKNLAHSVLRLQKSGFFYSADGHILPAAKYPDKRTLLIRVSEGFRYRFGGGEIYGMFGMDNIFGRKKSFRIFAGYKFFKLQIYDYNFLESDLFIGSDLFYDNKKKRDHLADYTIKSAAINLGYNLNPALSIGVQGNYRNVKYNSFKNSEIFFGENESDYYIASPFFKYEDYIIKISNPLFWKLTAQYDYYTKDEKDISYRKAFAKTSLVIPFTGSISLNLQATGGFTPREELPYSEKFDLYSTEDLSVRSGYEIIELTADKFAMFNFELRFNFLNTKIPPIFPLDLEIFLLADLAYNSFIDEKLFESDYKDAYGSGLRIKFENPVFAYFTFSYGLNRNKEGRFIYTGTAGF